MKSAGRGGVRRHKSRDFCNGGLMEVYENQKQFKTMNLALTQLAADILAIVSQGEKSVSRI